MVYEKRGKWYVVVDGVKKNFSTKAKAEKAAGINPLAALAAKPAVPVYRSFEEAVAVHGEDEDDLAEEE